MVNAVRLEYSMVNAAWRECSVVNAVWRKYSMVNAAQRECREYSALHLRKVTLPAVGDGVDEGGVF
jgi:hypothetical protein